MPYPDKIQKDKSISERICSYLVRETGLEGERREYFSMSKPFRLLISYISASLRFIGNSFQRPVWDLIAG